MATAPLIARHGTDPSSLLAPWTPPKGEALFRILSELPSSMAASGVQTSAASGSAPAPAARVGAPAAAAAPDAPAVGGGEEGVRASLQDLLARLPAQFVMVEIEARVEEKTPYVVVALQVRASRRLLRSDVLANCPVYHPMCLVALQLRASPRLSCSVVLAKLCGVPPCVCGGTAGAAPDWRTVFYLLCLAVIVPQTASLGHALK